MREAKLKRLFIENKLRAARRERVREWVKGVMGIQEGTCDEH